MPITVSLEDLTAFLDGELLPERAAEVAEAVYCDKELWLTLRVYCDQKAAIRALYDAVEGEPPPPPLRRLIRRLRYTGSGA